MLALFFTYLPLYLFSVCNSVCFSSIYRPPRQAAPARWRTVCFNTQYRTSDVAENLGRYFSYAERTDQGKDFELILMVKMEIRHPVEGQFGSEFPAICNHCVVMTA